MELLYKVNQIEVSQHVYFNLLDTLRDYCSAKPRLVGLQFSVEKTYYYECSKFYCCSKLFVKDSLFCELYLEKLKEVNDVFGL